MLECALSRPHFVASATGSGSGEGRGVLLFVFPGGVVGVVQCCQRFCLCVSGKKKTTALCLLDCLFLLLFSVFVEQVKEEDHCGLGPAWRSSGGAKR